MTCQHNRLCPVTLRLRDRAADWFHRVFKIEAADKFRAKPKRHSRRRHPDNGDFDPIDFLQDIRPNFCEWISRIQNFAAGFSFPRHVRCHHRHFGFCQRVHERLHAPIEFVIANDPGVVFQIIEEIDHERAVRSQADIGALVDIADVDQDRISILASPSPDLSNAARKPAEIGVALVIGSGQNVSVEVGRVKD